ncbi:uncharacterized protein LOC129230299 [Uloborus diversus]|uniref:uncharacterized protein LOC129230299 n=1 Tax=Uloborus diversus TaxID=327109 RepID=UPI00240938AF|nr:uncharacterized protein LOC129230299 [Uloborus diversus]
MAKRKALSFDEKLKIIQQYDEKKGVTNKQQFANEIGIPVSTLKTLLKKREEIESSAFSGISKRRRVRKGKNEDLEEVLYQWFQQARGNNLPINGPIMTEKANEIAKGLGINDFSGSAGWLDRFRKRYGIKYRQISGEAEAADDDNIAPWIENLLPNLLKDYAPEDVYNADEFGLFFKLMPDKSLVLKDEKCHGVLKQKYRKKLVQRYLREIESGEDSSCKINVLDAIHYVSAAWDEIAPDVIRNCFRKAHFESKSNENDLNVADFLDIEFEEQYPGYCSVDDDLPITETLEIQDMIDMAKDGEFEVDNEEEEEDEPPQLPSFISACDSVSVLRQALSSTENSEAMLRELNRIESFIIRNFRKPTSYDGGKQLLMENFLTKK